MDRQTESERTALISRRAFLGGMMGAAALPTFALRASTYAQSASADRSAGMPAVPAYPAHPAVPAPYLRVDARALRERIEKLSTFGRPAGGTFADGVSRIAYSDADIEGGRYVMGLLTAAGLGPSIDPAGNIFARRPGAESRLPPILFGSRIDSVPNGGNFDGDLGSLSALGVLEALQSADVRTRHPLEMVVWAHEEGFAFGRGLACSRIVAGEIAAADMDEVWNGMRRGEAIRRIGGNPDRILEARRPKGAHHCYLELHIEQGGTLERAGIPVGVVEGIVAIDRYEALITGVANHAGTTPIAERHDALLAAAHLTVAVRDAAARRPGRQVATVGQIEVTVRDEGGGRLPASLGDAGSVTVIRRRMAARRPSRIMARRTGVLTARMRLSQPPRKITTPTPLVAASATEGQRRPNRRRRTAP